MQFLKPKLTKHKREIVKDSVYYTVYNRDNGTCRLCGVKIELDLHHIFGRGKYLTNNINNCIMLCKYHHLEVVHKNNKYWRPILKEIVLNTTIESEV